MALRENWAVDDEFTPDDVNDINKAINKNTDDIKSTCATKDELKEAIGTAINSSY